MEVFCSIKINGDFIYYVYISNVQCFLCSHLYVGIRIQFYNYDFLRSYFYYYSFNFLFTSKIVIMNIHPVLFYTILFDLLTIITV